ncbi:hypothetical protein LCGC14_0714430 [marine sediment metagenome]|uniref:N-acetyltransferase domain-containing protein n=1 Tax=marine sediment metagenome TaxID=412755 RepID=A0A0F9QIM0_9ZZZZ
MKIKKVIPKDLKKIISLEQDVFNENAFSTDLIEKLINKNTFFLKLEIGKIKNKLIGFIIIIKDMEERVNIINFLVKQEHQNKGYGSYLLKNAIEEIKQLKEIHKIILNVQENNSIAIKLYQKFNFKINPKILEKYYQSGENAYLMELNIDSV